jgi:hypothetical protein
MRGLAETDSWEDDEAAKIYLTYSTTRDINRTGPTFEMLVVCIIQVSQPGTTPRTRITPQILLRKPIWSLSA